MRILHVTPSFHPAWAYGGIPRCAYELCRALVRLGESLTVWTTDAFDARRRLREPEAVVDGIVVRRLTIQEEGGSRATAAKVKPLGAYLGAAPLADASGRVVYGNNTQIERLARCFPERLPLVFGQQVGNQRLLQLRLARLLVFAVPYLLGVLEFFGLPCPFR